MTFFDLQQSQGKSVVENKLHLNLSSRAYEVLMQDADTFRCCDFKQLDRAWENHRLPSAVVNHLLIGFLDQTPPAMRQMKQRQQEFDTLLSDQKDVLSILRNHTLDLFLALRTGWRQTRGDSYYIRLTVLAQSALLSYFEEYLLPLKIASPQDSVSVEIKILLEEYALLPDQQRELIFYNKMSETIQRAIAQRNALFVTLHKSRRTYTLLPFRIQSDQEQRYNYLVGYQISKSGDYLPKATRLISLAQIQNCTEQNLPEKEWALLQKRLESEIRRKDIEFLSSPESPSEIRVQLTENGEDLYRRILYRRPRYVRKEPDHIYVFHCSQFQARSYFIRFGADAKILAPPSFAREIQAYFKAALEQYLK